MKKLAIITMVLAILFSCKKNDVNVNPNPPLTGNTLSSNAFIVDTLAISGVTDLAVVLLKRNTLLRPKVGDIMLAAPTVSNPLGFLRKVLSVTENASEITCNTEQSNLNDAFSQLNLNINYLDTFSSNALLASGETGSKLGITFKDYIPFDGRYNPIFNGELYFNIPSVKIEYAKKGGSLLPEKVALQAEFNTDGSSLEILYQGDGYFPEIVLNVFDLPVIKVPIRVTTQIGVITIPIPFTQKLIIKAFPFSMAGGYGYGKLKIRPEFSATLGNKFENSTWTNLNTYAIEASADSLIQADFAPLYWVDYFEDRTITKPEYRICPYGNDNLSTFFEIPMTMYFQTNIQHSPNYLLNFKMDVTGGAKQAFYTGIPQEYSMPGNKIEKTILEGDWPFIDTRDGQVYPYVKIGTQTWMTKNLNYNVGWVGRTWYGRYGLLYGWSAAQNACPPGWHIPSDEEWATLINYLGGDSVAGGKLKATTGWNGPNTGATNSSGFSGFPGGFGAGSDLFEAGSRGIWWTSTKADNWGNIWIRVLTSESAEVGRTTGSDIYEGYSVRCIKD